MKEIKDKFKKSSHYFKNLALKDLLLLGVSELETASKGVRPTAEGLADWVFQKLGPGTEAEHAVFLMPLFHDEKVKEVAPGIPEKAFLEAYARLTFADEISDPRMAGAVIGKFYENSFYRSPQYFLDGFEFLKSVLPLLNRMNSPDAVNHLIMQFLNLRVGLAEAGKDHQAEAEKKWRAATTTFQGMVYFIQKAVDHFVLPPAVMQFGTTGSAPDALGIIVKLNDATRSVFQKGGDIPGAIDAGYKKVILEDLIPLLRSELRVWDWSENGNGVILAGLYDREALLKKAGLAPETVREEKDKFVSDIKNRFAKLDGRRPDDIPDELALVWHLIYGDDVTGLEKSWKKGYSAEQRKRAEALFAGASWQNILLRASVGVTSEDRIYPSSIEEAKRIRRILESQKNGIDLEDAGQFLKFLTFAQALRIFPDRYLFSDPEHSNRGVLPADFFLRHADYEPGWDNAHYIPSHYESFGPLEPGNPALVMGSNRISGRLSAVGSEVSHLFEDLASQKFLYPSDQTLPEYEDRAGLLAMQPRIPYLFRDEGQAYAAETFHAGVGMVRSFRGNKAFQQKMKGFFSRSHRNRLALLRGLSSGDPDLVLKVLSPSEIYFLGMEARENGRTFSEWGKAGADLLEATAALAKIEGLVKASQTDLADFKREIDQVAGISALTLHGRANLRELRLEPYDRYFSYASSHSLAERVSADFSVQLMAAMHAAGLPAKVRPWLVLPALEAQWLTLTSDTKFNATLRDMNKAKPFSKAGVITREGLRAYAMILDRTLEAITAVTTPQNLRQWAEQNMRQEGVIKKGLPEGRREAGVDETFRGRLIERLAGLSQEALTGAASLGQPEQAAGGGSVKQALAEGLGSSLGTEVPEFWGSVGWGIEKMDRLERSYLSGVWDSLENLTPKGEQDILYLDADEISKRGRQHEKQLSLRFRTISKQVRTFKGRAVKGSAVSAVLDSYTAALQDTHDRIIRLLKVYYEFNRIERLHQEIDLPPPASPLEALD